MSISTTTETPADRLYEAAMTQIEQGELRDASGTLWDATASAFTALAERRGWAISKHMRFDDVYSRVEPEILGNALFDGFDAAVLMERNWVEDYDLSESWVLYSAQQIREMIDALQSV